MPAKPLTEEQKREAVELKSLFRNWQAVQQRDGGDWSQEWCAEQLGFGQSALNQYLNGKIPLNPEAATKFAKLIGIDVSAFSARLASNIKTLAEGVDLGGPLPEAPSPVPMRQRSPWPFPGLDEKKVRRLKSEDALRLEGAILLAAAQLHLDLTAAGTGKRNAA